jgi:hypothetical protein
MSALREKLLAAYRTGNFLQSALYSTHSEQESPESVAESLAILHNEGKIDLIEQFKSLHNKQGLDFFLTRNLFEKALPHLNAPIQHVMDCVAHLSAEAGQDLAANWIFASFIDFCSSDPSRPENGLKLIKENPDKWTIFVSPIIIAGTRVDIAQYLEEALILLKNENIEIRKNALFSLGRIQYGEHKELSKKAIQSIERSTSAETDDQLLGTAIKSLGSICIADGSLVDDGIRVLELCLSKGGEYSLHAAAELFGSEVNKLPEPMLEVVMHSLLAINPGNKGTLELIDMGVYKLLKREDSAKGIEFIESFLLAHEKRISLKSMKSVIHGLLTSDKQLLKTLMTRWFIRGDRVLCDAIRVLVDSVHDEEIPLEIDPAQIPAPSDIHLIYLARKTIGYLFMKPITCASVLISLMRQAGGANKKLESLLFDPMLLNYSASVKSYLRKQVEKEEGSTKEVIEESLRSFESYLEGLKSVGDIPELYPSQTEREAHARYMHEAMSAAYKAAMKKSIVNLICSKSVILHGKKSINYVRGPLGQTQRMEILMTSHGAEIEVPRQDHIDPFGLDYMLRIFRAERLRAS